MKSLFVIIFIISSINYSSYINANPKLINNYFSLNDSTSNSELSQTELNKNKIKISNPFYFDSPFFLHQEFLFSEFYKDYSLQNNITEDDKLNPNNSLSLSKMQLSKALKINYSFVQKNELGTFGKILGSAAGVTAVGLGIYHIIKYKDEYFK